MDPGDRERGEFEGMVETTDRTEKELEPLRLLTFRMATVRERIAVIERDKYDMDAGEEQDAIRQVKVMTDEVVLEALALAEALGQRDEFQRSLEAKYDAAPKRYVPQILAMFSAVDVFLMVNGFVRTVAPPVEDVAEVIWQRCLEEHLERYGDEPHPLLLTDLGIFRDTMEGVLFQAAQNRIRSLNDSLSTFAATSAIYRRERAVSSSLPDLEDLM